MTLNQLASKIAKVEGKKHQASIGDIREILKILCQFIYDDKFPFPYYEVLFKPKGTIILHRDW